MTIEISLLITFISAGCAVYFGLRNLKRNENTDVKEEATSMAIMVAKLENIETGITDIKGEIKSIKDGVQKDHDKLITVIELVDNVSSRVRELTNDVHRLEAEVNEVKQTQGA